MDNATVTGTAPEPVFRPVHPLVAERIEDLDVYHGVHRSWSSDDEPRMTQMVIADVMDGHYQMFQVYLDDEGTVSHRPIPEWQPGLPPGVYVEWTTPLK